MEKPKLESTNLFYKFLNLMEKAGNALPHPATLFALFALGVVVLSGIAQHFHWEVVHPGTKSYPIADRVDAIPLRTIGEGKPLFSYGDNG